MNMSVSQVLNKKGKKEIYVLFNDKKRSAEGIYPSCKIFKNDGFTEDEVDALEAYMSKNGSVIEEMAKGISLWKAFSKQ